MERNFIKHFNKYIEQQQAFPWTVVHEHDNPSFVGNNSLVLGYIRNRLIFDAVNRYSKSGISILDVGIYPGVIPKVMNEFYPGAGNFTYFGCGLGFTPEFSAAMEKINVTLLEADLDPRLSLNLSRPTNILLPDVSMDLVFCTDVIEHFFDPSHMLQEINRVLKLQGILILTTDNVSRYGSLLAVLKGESNNVPLMESSFYFEGDWRPHFREYSKSELFQLLKFAGFEIIEHTYFDGEFSSYKVIGGCLTKKIAKNSFVGRLKRIAKMALTGELLVSLFSHLPQAKDNHFIVAKKTVPYAEMLVDAPKITHTIDEWVAQRKKYAKW